MDKQTYENYLEQNGTMTYSNVGISMLPLLKPGRDLFTVRKKGQERCKKYEVVLYRRPPSSYVLHRVVEVREKDYVILGDNCIKKEYGITDADIIGVMTSYVHKGKERTTAYVPYRVYSWIWVNFSSVRIILQKVKHKWRRMWHET